MNHGFFVDDSGMGSKDPYCARNYPTKRRPTPGKRRDFRYLWNKYRTLYATGAASGGWDTVREALEAEGHRSPACVPPRELAKMVAEGRR